MLITIFDLTVNEAEVLDPWEEPEPIEAYPVRRKEPTVRFA